MIEDSSVMIKFLIIATIMTALCRLVLASEVSGHIEQAAKPNEPGATDAEYQWRASDLIGRMVKNAEDEEIGKIEDFLLDAEGAPVLVVMSVGGFLGVGQKLVTVPYEELRIDPNTAHALYDTTREKLQAKPEFDYKPPEIPWTDNR